MSLTSRSRARTAARPVIAARTAVTLVALLSGVAAVPGAGRPSDVVSKEVSPHPYPITNGKVARWAAVLAPVTVRRRPTSSSREVTKLEAITGDLTQNIVLVLRGVDVDAAHTWYEVRLPTLPNNSTGWVPHSALGNLHAVRTHLYVNRASFTATLKRGGRTIFTARIGVGRSYWRTPAGEFYIRDKLTDLDDPFYGPIAFGTSARSPVLTDWPGGGVIGIHGTDRPDLLPGRVSHGCIRMVNDAIVRLARLMPVGTPLTIT
jgi:hypothetical protein